MSDQLNPSEIQLPDPALVRANARMAWERRTRGQITVQERIGQSVPWWLIAIAAVFYALSAPHTASTFDKLTPGWGWLAPIGIEVGLLYVAFIRTYERRPFQHAGLHWLLFATAIIVNGVGGMGSVLESVQLSGLTFAEIFAKFGQLPATSQAALLLVPLMAFVVPIGTEVAGKGVAALILDRRTQGSPLDDRWRMVAPTIEYEALRDAAVSAGLRGRDAGRWAAGVLGMSGNIRVEMPASVRPQLSAVSGSSAEPITDGQTFPDSAPAREPAAPATPATSRSSVRPVSDARTTVRNYLSADPTRLTMSVRDLAAATGVGRTTCAEVLKEMKESRE